MGEVVDDKGVVDLGVALGESAAGAEGGVVGDGGVGDSAVEIDESAAVGGGGVVADDAMRDDDVGGSGVSILAKSAVDAGLGAVGDG